jgi:hypothetical protein
MLYYRKSILLAQRLFLILTRIFCMLIIGQEINKKYGSLFNPRSVNSKSPET